MAPVAIKAFNRFNCRMKITSTAKAASGISTAVA